MSLTAHALVYAVEERRLVDGVSFGVEAGQLHAVLGPNGAGKSTLLRLLAGDLAAVSGDVQLNGRPVRSWTPLQRARQRAVLPQQESLRFGFTAEQVVSLGRFPCPRHRSDVEQQIVHEALSAAGVAHLARRKYPTLSGGERSRVQFARVMAQLWEAGEQQRFLLLDEPTASLDLAHQHECLKMARCFAGGGAGVLAILHDPNLAMAYADQVTLLREGRVLASGPPEAVLTADNLHALFGVRVGLHRPEGAMRPVIWALGP